ncbi:helix-turn-helix domain-containing protein [Trichlorobacter ammonificans]|uniref:Bacteriophage CI repressor N-terminal domain-containing protein n=1 Tax=Trichlorobacter ammonificans TaxID=2916410 RepID=A0ABM9DAB3_9BACT|nr:helix-turn-helix domain-containing protein [Trichlorobacter ammonificans]CAH2032096.1 protein of unknown function [Trichlorobacter ammonificans]
MSRLKMTKSDFVDVVSRLREVSGEKREIVLAEMLGFTQSTFAQRKKRNSTPTEEVYWLCKEKGWDFDYVMTGETECHVKAKTPTIEAVIQMMESMDADTQEDIRLSVQKEKLLRELMKEKQEKEAA